MSDSGTSSMLEYLRPNRVPVYRQRETAECGLACIGMVAAFHGFESDLAHLRQRFPASMRGLSLKTLVYIANSMRLAARSVRLDPTSLIGLSLPAVLHWDLRQFVVLVKIRKLFGRLRYLIHDPALGARWLSAEEMNQRFTGIAVEFNRMNDFEPKNERRTVQIWDLCSLGSGFGRSVASVIALSLVIQIGTLASPLFVRAVIDIVLPSADFDLLLVLSISFALLALTLGFTVWLRSFVLSLLINSASFQLSTSLLRKLLELPLKWFTARSSGTIISSLQSVNPISDAFARGIASSFVDGLLALTTLCVMMYLSLQLTLVSVCILGIYGFVRWAVLVPMMEHRKTSISAEASDYNVASETIKGIAAIKLAAQENARRVIWQQKKVEVTNARIRIDRLNAVLQALDVLAPGLEAVLVIYFGSRLVMNEVFSLGTAFSYMLYKQFFARAIVSLLQAVGEYKNISAHLENVADITLCPSEAQDKATVTAQKLKGAIRLEDIWFRYGAGESDILRGIELNIRPGEIVAIAGKSGGGKTTLLKIMQGLHDPSRGQIWIDDQPISAIGRRSFRAQIGVVAQDDILYAGSIAANISFFDPELSIERVVECAKLTAIHHDILAMPMGYETHCGDAGSSLSGGQRQRILLARAIYRRPKILFMDEGTAHLDVDTESRVLSAVRQLGITCIVVAHRPEALAAADRIIVLVDGKLTEA